MVGNPIDPHRPGVGTPQSGSPTDPPSPDTALGVWAAWLKGQMGAFGGHGLGAGGTPQWLLPLDKVAGTSLPTGVDQLGRMLANDPLLASIDRMWNANPLHTVIPVNWAEVVRALRTVWLRSMADPGPRRDRDLGIDREDVDLRHRGLERCQRPLAGPAPDHGAAEPRSRTTSGSRPRNGTAIPPTGRSRTCTCWPRTSS